MEKVGRRAGVVAVGLALVLGGCGTPPLKVRLLTDPPVENVTVTVSQNGPEVDEPTLRPVKLPAEIDLSRDAATFAFETRGTGIKSSSVTLAREEVEAAPVVGGVRQLSLAVEQEFEEQVRYDVVFDPKSGEFVARTGRVRAYEKVIEDSGGSPSRVKELPDNCGVQGMALSPDGKKLIYAKAIPRLAELRSGKGSRKLVQLEACNLEMIDLVNQGGVTLVTRDAFRDVYPSFTQDGQFIRFASNRMRQNFLDVLQIKATGQEGGIQLIHVDTGNQSVLRPSTAKDGTTAFAVRSSEAGSTLSNGGIHIWVHGGPDHPYPTEVAVGTDPQISPDGRRIVFIDREKNLCVINSDASTPIVLLGDAAEIEHKYRTARFEQLVAEVTAGGATLRDALAARFGAAVADQITSRYGDLLADAEPRELLDLWLDENFDYDTENFFPYADPSWSPDGRHIVFTSMKGSDATGLPNQNIWYVSVDGGQPSQLTSNGSADTNPLVAPDGQLVYFLSNRGRRLGIWAMKPPPEMAFHP